jgi:hypothetical protein
MDCPHASSITSSSSSLTRQPLLCCPPAVAHEHIARPPPFCEWAAPEAARGPHVGPHSFGLSRGRTTVLQYYSTTGSSRSLHSM